MSRKHTIRSIQLRRGIQGIAAGRSHDLRGMSMREPSTILMDSFGAAGRKA